MIRSGCQPDACTLNMLRRMVATAPMDGAESSAEAVTLTHRLACDLVVEACGRLGNTAWRQWSALCAQGSASARRCQPAGHELHGCAFGQQDLRYDRHPH